MGAEGERRGALGTIKGTESGNSAVSTGIDEQLAPKAKEAGVGG